MKDKIKRYLKFLLSCTKLNLYIIPNTSCLPDLSLDKELRFDHLNEKEISELIKFNDTYTKGWTTFSAEGILDKLRADHRCFLARHNEEIIGFAWFATKELYSPTFHCTFVNEEHRVLYYNGFIRPDYRGKNIISGIIITAFKDLSKEGYIACTYSISSTNISSMKSMRKFNSLSVGQIIYGYFLGYYFFFPFVKKNIGIKVYLSDSPWHRWKTCLSKRGLARLIHKDRHVL